MVCPGLSNGQAWVSNLIISHYFNELECVWCLFILQRHDIIKRRLDSHGQVIEARPDGIGAPKVSNVVFLKFSWSEPTSLFYMIEFGLKSSSILIATAMTYLL